MKRFTLTVLFSVAAAITAMAQDNYVTPDLLRQAEMLQQHYTPKISYLPELANMPRVCGYSSPPQASQIYGWMAKTSEGRYDFAVFPVRNCMGETFIQVQVNPPGGNPRNPKKYYLRYSDFREISPHDPLSSKSFFSDIFEDIKDFVDHLTKEWKAVWSELKKVIKDGSQLWEDVDDLVKDAGNLLNVILKHGGQKVAADVVQAETKSRIEIKNGRNVKTYWAWGESMNSACQRNDDLPKVLVKALEESSTRITFHNLFVPQ